MRWGVSSALGDIVSALGRYRHALEAFSALGDKLRNGDPHSILKLVNSGGSGINLASS